MKRITSYSSLKSWRLVKGLNQREAAEMLGITQAMYARIELGRGRPRAVKGKAISDRTGVPFEIVMQVV